jgi:hypothetical protein
VLRSPKRCDELTNVNVEIGVVDVQSVGGLLEVLVNVRSLVSILGATVKSAYNVSNTVSTDVVVLNNTEGSTGGLALDKLGSSVKVVSSLGEGRAIKA